MADISLTHYLRFLNHFAESRELIPFEKTPKSIASAMLLRCCLPVFSGPAIGIGFPAFSMKCGTQKTRYFSWIKPVHAPVSHWAGKLPSRCGLAFWSPYQTKQLTPSKVCAIGEKCHAIQVLPINN